MSIVLKALSIDVNRYNEYCSTFLTAAYIGLKCKMFQYEKDMSKVGTPSDYGKQLMIGNRHININRSSKFNDKIHLQENEQFYDNIYLQEECHRPIRSCTRLNDIMEQPLAMICRY